MFMRLRQLAEWRPLRWTRGPLGLALFACLFVGHCSTLERRGEFSGDLLRYMPFFPGANRCFWWPEIYVFETTNGRRFVHWDLDIEEQPWCRDEDAEFVGRVQLWPTRFWAPQEGGMWATTRRIWDTSIATRLNDPALERQVRRRAHWWMLAELSMYDDSPSPEEAEWLRRFAAGPEHSYDIIWSGFLHNAAALGLFTLLARAGMLTLSAALQWLVRACRKETFEHAIAQGRCPRCAYDIRCLPAPVCPECGLSLLAPRHPGTTTAPSLSNTSATAAGPRR